MTRTGLFAVASLVTLSGCVATIPDDRFACSSTAECPAGFRCEGGFCRNTTALDAGIVDASGADAGVADASRPDAAAYDGCVPRPCEPLECGQVFDGCGITHCGDCVDSSHSCGGGGTPNVCGEGTCTPRTCEGVGATCGALSDGCGELLDCGACAEGERCSSGSCVPCADPLRARPCTMASECGPGEACIANVCLATCGDEAGLRSSIENLRSGATPVAHICISIGSTTVVPVVRDGCPGLDVVEVVATSPSATESQFFMNRWPLSSAIALPSPTTLSTVNVTTPDASTYAYLTRRIAVSPDGQYAVYGYALSDAGRAGELLRVALADGTLHRTPTVGLTDVLWLDDDRVLVVAEDGTPNTPSIQWLRSTATGFTGATSLVDDFGGRWNGVEVLPSQSTVLASGLPGEMHGETWADGLSDFRTFAIARDELLDGANDPVRSVALSAYGAPELPVFPGLPAPRLVGSWLVASSTSGGALEIRRVEGTSTTTLAIMPPQGLYIGGSPVFHPIDERHVIIPDAPRTLVVRLPD